MEQNHQRKGSDLNRAQQKGRPAHHLPPPSRPRLSPKNILWVTHNVNKHGGGAIGAKSKFAFAVLALGAVAGAATIAKSYDPATSLKLCTTVPVRLFRLPVTVAMISFGTTHAHDRYCSCRLCDIGINCQPFASALSFI